MTNLYIITGTDPDDLLNDLSLFVRAETPEQAAKFWADYYAVDFAWEVRPPTGTYDFKIFEVDISNNPEPGVIEWYSNSIDIVGFIKEVS